MLYVEFGCLLRRSVCHPRTRTRGTAARRRDALAQSFSRTSLLYIRQIVEPQAFSIFQLEDDAGTNVSPPCPQALQLPRLNGKRDLANLRRTDRDRRIRCSPVVDIHAR